MYIIYNRNSSFENGGRGYGMSYLFRIPCADGVGCGCGLGEQGREGEYLCDHDGDDDDVDVGNGNGHYQDFWWTESSRVDRVGVSRFPSVVDVGNHRHPTGTREVVFASRIRIRLG